MNRNVKGLEIKHSQSSRASTSNMNSEQMMVLGLTSEHLIESRGALMHEQAAEAFSALQARANDAGFQLAVASSYRSYGRQLAIFNGKWGGERPVLDDDDRVLVRQDYPAEEWLHLCLLYTSPSPRDLSTSRMPSSA